MRIRIHFPDLNLCIEHPATVYREDKEEKVKRCLIRTCNRPVTASVSKKWLVRLKKRLMKKVTLDWDRVGKASVKATFLVCAKHSGMVGKCCQKCVGRGSVSDPGWMGLDPEFMKSSGYS